MNYPTVTCGGCEGSGISPEDHGQGNIEYLGCMDCMGLGQFKMVPVDVVVLSRQPCNNCEGTGATHNLPQLNDKTVTVTAQYQCPSCSGSGTTWPDPTEYEVEEIRKALATLGFETNLRGIRNLHGDILDALVVQEGTTND